MVWQGKRRKQPWHPPEEVPWDSELLGDQPPDGWVDADGWVHEPNVRGRDERPPKEPFVGGPTEGSTVLEPGRFRPSTAAADCSSEPT